MSLAFSPKLCPSVKFDEAALQTGEEMSRLLLSLPENIRSTAIEIRIRCGQPVAVAVPNNSHLIKSGTPVSRGQMNDIFTRICKNAVYSHQTEIAEGFITLAGGHRAGICGRAVHGSNGMVTITDISSICIRIAHEVKGCGDSLVQEFYRRGRKGLLIAGPPCSGKTTLLRDIARSVGEDSNVSIIDERNEIAAVRQGMPQLDIGCRSDVLTGFSKTEGMLHAIRCLSPDVMLCDEIGSVDEARAVQAAFNAGVTVIATIHGSDLNELTCRRQFCLLRDSRAFASVALLKKGAFGQVTQIVDMDKL